MENYAKTGSFTELRKAFWAKINEQQSKDRQNRAQKQDNKRDWKALLISGSLKILGYTSKTMGIVFGGLNLMTTLNIIDVFTKGRAPTPKNLIKYFTINHIRKKIPGMINLDTGKMLDKENIPLKPSIASDLNFGKNKAGIKVASITNQIFPSSTMATIVTAVLGVGIPTLLAAAFRKVGDARARKRAKQDKIDKLESLDKATSATEIAEKSGSERVSINMENALDKVEGLLKKGMLKSFELPNNAPSKLTFPELEDWLIKQTGLSSENVEIVLKARDGSIIKQNVVIEGITIRQTTKISALTGIEVNIEPKAGGIYDTNKIIGGLVEDTNILSSTENWIKFDYIFKDVSDLEILSFISDLDAFIDKYFNDWSQINILRQKWKEIFLDKFSITGLDESVLERYWDYMFGKKIDKTIEKIGVDVFNKILRDSYRTTILSMLSNMVKDSGITDPSDVFGKFKESLDYLESNKGIILFSYKYYHDSMALLFTSENLIGGYIDGSFNDFNSYKGAFNELEIFLNHFPAAIRQFYEKNNIDPRTVLEVTLRYEYTNNREIMTEAPHIVGTAQIRDNTRFPDFGLWRYYYVIPETGESVEVVKITPVKYYSSYKKVVSKDSMKDGLSSVYVAILNNFNGRNVPPAKYMNYEIELINTRYLHNDINSFKDLLIKDWLELLFSDGDQKIDFISCFYKTKQGQKVSKNEVRELTIIEEVNKELWKILGYEDIKDLKKNEIIQKIRELGRDNEFVQKIFENNIELFQSSRIATLLKNKVKTRSQEKIQSLSNEVVIHFMKMFILRIRENLLNTIEFNDPNTGKLISTVGLERAINFESYFVSNKKLEDLSINQLKSLFKKVFVLDENGDLSEKGLEDNWNRNKAFRIIHKKKGVSFEFALIEISQNPQNKIDNPSNWNDGVIVGGNIYKNAMFTDHYGNLLSSKFFDVVNQEFKKRSFKDIIKEVEEEFENPTSSTILRDSKDNAYGIRVLFVMSAVESNSHSNILVDLSLSDPHFIHESLDMHYSIEIIDEFLGDLEYEPHRSQRAWRLKKKDLERLTTLLEDNEKENLITTEQEVLNVIYNMFFFLKTDSKRGDKRLRKRHLPYIYGLLNKLNTLFDPETGLIYRQSGRDKEIIEGIITGLFDSETEARNLFFRYGDDTQLIVDFTFKEWMHGIYEKIKDYDVLPEEENPLIISAQNKLEQITGIFGELHPEIDRKFFDDNEIKAGKEIFEVIQGLFGHFTVRLMIMGFMDVFRHSDGRFTIEINRRPRWGILREHLNRLKIIPASRTDKYTFIAAIARAISEDEAYSLLFSDSHIFMPVKGRFSLLKNALFFGYTPILFEKGGGFASRYKRFEQDNPRIELYTDSCEAMMEVTERAIINKVLAEAQYSDFPFEKWAKINSLVERARYLIFHPRGSLRFKFEDFINSRSLKSTDHPSAHRLRIDDFEIEVSKEDLEGLNIQTWGYLMRNEGYDYDMIKDYMYKKTRDPIWLD